MEEEERQIRRMFLILNVSKSNFCNNENNKGTALCEIIKLSLQFVWEKYY